MSATWITITGNLAETPQLRITSSGKATTRARWRWTTGTATTRGSGSTVRRRGTPSSLGPVAEALAQGRTKGERVIVHGRLQARD